MEFLKVGHVTLEDKGTGVTVFLFDKPAVAAYQRMGASPASHELATLDFDANVPTINALVFAGGSAFGLAAVEGVMRWLKKEGRGYATRCGVVPIVPAVALFDLAVKSDRSPTWEDGYQACEFAKENNMLQGRIGAATGASVGKFVAKASPMSGGLGCAELSLPNGVKVLAYAAVNSLGDIRDASGKIIAGACFPDGDFADCEKYLLAGHDDTVATVLNTSLVAVFTNAVFTKIELKRISHVGVSGMARAISPVFTRYDGDTLFCVSLGNHVVSEQVVSAMAAEAVRAAIVNAVKGSIILR